MRPLIVCLVTSLPLPNPAFGSRCAKAKIGEGGIHGGAFGVKFKERADAVGMTRCCMEITSDPQYPRYPGGSAAFVKDVFNLTENGKQ
jgi:hypothetical protein